MSQFLGSKGFVEVTGPRVNRGAGYGLEMSCVYKLYGPKSYTDKLLNIVKSPKGQGLL